MGEAVAVHAVAVLEMPDHRFDSGTPFHLTFDGGRDAALLTGGKDAQFIDAGRVVAAVAGIGEDAFERGAGELFDLGNHGLKRMAIVRPPRQGLGVDGELPALATVQRCRDGNLDAELIGFVGLALADAFHLGRVQGVNLGQEVALLLRHHPLAQPQRAPEHILQRRIAFGLALNVADGAAKESLEFPKLAARPLELLGVSIALVLDQGALAEAHITLTEIDPGPLRLFDQTLARLVDQLGVGREGDVLLRHRGVDHGAGEVGGLRGPGLHRHRQALLQQRGQALLAHPLTPAGHRRTVQRQLVTKEFGAAKILIIRVLKPARADLVIR